MFIIDLVSLQGPTLIWQCGTVFAKTWVILVRKPSGLSYSVQNGNLHGSVHSFISPNTTSLNVNIINLSCPAGCFEYFAKIDKLKFSDPVELFIEQSYIQVWYIIRFVSERPLIWYTSWVPLSLTRARREKFSAKFRGGGKKNWRRHLGGAKKIFFSTEFNFWCMKWTQGLLREPNIRDRVNILTSTLKCRPPLTHK